MRIRVEQPGPRPPADDLSEVAAVLPAYNEQKHLARAVSAALEVGVGLVACVDDGSADATGRILDELAADPRVLAVHHEVNRGKQAAVRTGLRAALSAGGMRGFAVLDADMQNDPALLPLLCAPLGEYDVVIGARRRDRMPPQRKLANALANLPYNVLAGVAVHDVQSGFRVYTREVADFLAENLTARGGYTLEHTTMLLFGRLARLRRRDFRIAEVPVPCAYGEAESHIRVADNLALTRAALYHAAALGVLRM
ncbi:MAG: glycosyltransferase family 2 protein [Planctomycetota bacterium]